MASIHQVSSRRPGISGYVVSSGFGDGIAARITSTPVLSLSLPFLVMLVVCSAVGLPPVGAAVLTVGVIAAINRVAVGWCLREATRTGHHLSLQAESELLGDDEPVAHLMDRVMNEEQSDELAGIVLEAAAIYRVGRPYPGLRISDLQGRLNRLFDQTD